MVTFLDYSPARGRGLTTQLFHAAFSPDFRDLCVDHLVVLAGGRFHLRALHSGSNAGQKVDGNDGPYPGCDLLHFVGLLLIAPYGRKRSSASIDPIEGGAASWRAALAAAYDPSRRLYVPVISIFWMLCIASAHSVMCQFSVSLSTTFMVYTPWLVVPSRPTPV